MQQRSVSHSTTSSNVLNCMCVSANIPEDWKEAPSQWFFMGDELTKVSSCLIERDHTNFCLMRDM